MKSVFHNGIIYGILVSFLCCAKSENFNIGSVFQYLKYPAATELCIFSSNVEEINIIEEISPNLPPISLIHSDNFNENNCLIEYNSIVILHELSLEQFQSIFQGVTQRQLMNNVWIILSENLTLKNYFNQTIYHRRFSPRVCIFQVSFSNSFILVNQLIGTATSVHKFKVINLNFFKLNFL